MFALDLLRWRTAYAHDETKTRAQPVTLHDPDPPAQSHANPIKRTLTLLRPPPPILLGFARSRANLDLTLILTLTLTSHVPPPAAPTAPAAGPAAVAARPCCAPRRCARTYASRRRRSPRPATSPRQPLRPPPCVFMRVSSGLPVRALQCRGSAITPGVVPDNGLMARILTRWQMST